MSGKQLLLILLVGLLLLAGLLFYVLGEQAWRLWSIPVMLPAFADMRSILAGVQASRLGFDPVFQNPLDPFGRVMAYPRLWLFLAAWPLTTAHTTAFAVGEIVLFLAALFIFVDRLERASAVLIAAMAVSPAVMLCLERGNTDLIVFFLLSLALALLSRAPVGALLLTELAAFLKLYPVMAFGMLLRLTRRTAVLWILAAVAVFAVYLALTWRDVQQILAVASKGVGFNYGAGVLSLWLRDLTGSFRIAAVVMAFAYLLAYVILVVALYHSQQDAAEPGEASTRLLDAFRVGVLVYLGTFLQGNTWNYRLIFLIFTIPQLVDWSHVDMPGTRRAARLALACVLLSAWLPLAGASEPPAASLAGVLQVLADELVNWSLFGFLSYLLFASLPEWIRGQARLFFEKYRKLASARSGAQ